MTADEVAIDGPGRADDTDTTVADQPGPERDGIDNAEPAAPPLPPDRRASRIRWLASPLMVVGILAVLSVGLTTVLYFTKQRADIQTGDAAARSVVSAASQGVTALLSYAPDSLESDLAAAKSHLTGEFLAYYSKFSDEVLGPTAKQKQITTKATVVRVAVSELRPESAIVLFYVNQASSSKDKPFVLTANSAIVTLTKTDGTWLISAFEPV